MNPEDPASAQRIVSEYAEVLRRDLERGRLPAPADSLPFAKPVIKTAIETSVQALTSMGQLTEELRDFLQTAYLSLAEYVTADSVRLMAEYTHAGEELAADSRCAHEKITGPAWRTLVEDSRLAGEIARSMATEAERLQQEFRLLAV